MFSPQAYFTMKAGVYMEKIIEQEILERLVRLETKLDNYNGLREKLEDICIISKSMEERVQKLESSYTWLWRTLS